MGLPLWLQNVLRCSHRLFCLWTPFVWCKTMSRILLILAVIWRQRGLFATFCFLKFFKEEKSPTHSFLGQKHMCSKQPHSGMSMGKFWEATAILEKLLLYNKIWWDVSIFSNTIRFGHYSCFFFLVVVLYIAFSSVAEPTLRMGSDRDDMGMRYSYSESPRPCSCTFIEVFCEKPCNVQKLGTTPIKWPSPKTLTLVGSTCRSLQNVPAKKVKVQVCQKVLAGSSQTPRCVFSLDSQNPLFMWSIWGEVYSSYSCYATPRHFPSLAPCGTAPPWQMKLRHRRRWQPARRWRRPRTTNWCGASYQL